MRDLKVALHTVYYQMILSLRIKTAFLLSLAFPVFLYLFFGNIWGNTTNVEYFGFLLSGVIGLSITSDGIFSVGPVIKIYYASKLLKFFRTLPMKAFAYYAGLFLNRILRILVSVIFLCVTAAIAFKYYVGINEILRFLVGTFFGLTMFALLGLVFAFLSRSHGGEQGTMNFVYFIIIFMTDTFYPITQINEFFKTVSYFIPLTYVLDFMRTGNPINLLVIMGWIVVLAAIFYRMITRTSIKR